MTRAKDIMRTDVICIEADTPAVIAVNIIKNGYVTSLPVLHPNGSVAGTLSESDVMKIFMRKKHKNIGEITAGEIMTKDAVTANENDNVSKVGCYLLNNHFRQLPVVSHGRYVGLISRRELLKHMVEVGGLG